MTEYSHDPQRSWPQKFRDAFRGVARAVRQESSFRVHFAFTALVLLSGALLRLSAIPWCLLVLSIFIVLSAETFNCALEHLAQAVDRKHNPRVGAALDMASGAVLLAAFGAAAVGLIVFLVRVAELLGPAAR